MDIDKTGLDSKVFKAFSETSNRRYLYLCNMQTGASRWSKSAVKYLEVPSEYMEHAEVALEECIHPDDRERYHHDIELIFKGEKKYHESIARIQNKRGDYVICTCKGMVLKGEGEEPDFFVDLITNHDDNVDTTTNLYNIYEFMGAMSRLKESREPSLVMMVGINQFGSVNENFGYAFGNRVLKEFALQLIELVHGKGMVYRMDGPKFALYMPPMDKEGTREFYAKIQELARKNIKVDGNHVLLSVSGGAVLVDNSDIGEYSIRASVAYAQEKSKEERHSQLVFFNSEKENGKLKNLEMFETIRQCVLRGFDGFYLCYQPLVRASDGKITGMEALLRWKKEPYGNVPPGEFIQWLEKDDCFFELGSWILKQALIDAKEILKDHPDFKVNVNVSYTQIDRMEFREVLLDTLKEIDYPPRNLCIELTERCRVIDIDQLRELLEFCASYGIRVALDDFGTGTASLNLLRMLPITCLKLDRTFVSNIQTNQTDEIIVEMVINSANKLGINVCLEGIETQQLRDYVQKFKVGTHQGYYYSRPVPIDDFKKLF
jgi:diguanylate cyclase (GGDEF)-like protein